MSVSIRWRLTTGIAAALIITLIAILVTLRLALAGILQGDLDDDLSRDAGLISAQVSLLGSLDDHARLQEIVDSYAGGGLASSFLVVIRDREGEPVASSAGVESSLLSPGADELRGVLDGRALSRTVDAGEGRDLRVRSSRLSVGAETIGVVQVAEDTELATHPLQRLQTILVAEGIGGVLLALVIGFWLARGAVKPLEGVISVAAEIEASDLHRRIGARASPREVQRLADTFDAMLERLETAFRQQKDFVLDMSHELRTPLTALRGNIDVLLMDDRLEGEMRSHLERMSGEVARLIRLTSNLLYLAHAEAGREVDRRPVELDVLCLEVYRQTKDLRPEVKFRLGHEDQVTVMGDRDLLKQLVLNLVDNSLKYTPARGNVTLSLFREPAHARIVVQDTGPGISRDQIPLIFQRFYRADGRGGQAGGAGIGLAISEWIARAHGGEISVESEMGKGSAFTALIPLGADVDCRGDGEPEQD